MRDEERFMRRALSLAEEAIGVVFPNPLVGAVIVSGGEVVGEGFYGGPGTPHAECVALARAGSRSRGGTLYINLEPCCHFGTTPPCTAAIRDAGIARVIFGIYDPDQRIRGRGAEFLKRSGIEVVAGVCAAEALELNLPYVHQRLTGGTFVLLKLAASLDGRLTATGRMRLTGEDELRFVHHLRAWTEAIAVGIGTVEADDPALDRRFFSKPLPPPVRIVFDTSLSFPPDHRWLASGERTILYCGEAVDPARRSALERSGAEVAPIPAGEGGLDLAAWQRDVGRRGIMSVLVEGGGRIATSMVREGLFDRLVLVVAPLISGTDGVSWFQDRLAPAWLDRGELSPVRLVSFGSDAAVVYDRRRVTEYRCFVTGEKACVHGIG